MHKSKPLFMLALKLVGGPAAGAFGLWLATASPDIWQAVCTAGQ